MSLSAPSCEPSGVRALACALRRVRFEVAEVEGFLGTAASAALFREQTIPASRVCEREIEAVGDRRELAALISVFITGQTVPAAVLDAALRPLGLEGAAQLGLVKVESGGARALIDLRPHAVRDDAGAFSWWIASDLGQAVLHRPLPHEHVLGIGGASLTLIDFTVPDLTESVLDLGTGCGIQAMYASRHASKVTATDLSDRALAFARFNAALNGVDLELIPGDMFHPVAGRVFDLIISNPPFVIEPLAEDSGSYIYRNAGLPGDELVRELCRDVGDYLAPGGVAQFLANWEIGDLEWYQRIEGWIPSELDAWVVQREVQDPAQYAEMWLRDAGTSEAAGEDHYRQDYLGYLNDFEDRGTRAIGFGEVTLRRPPRPSTPRLRRFEELSGRGSGSLGAHVSQCLKAWDWLCRKDDAQLHDSYLVCSADLTQERYYRPGEAEPQVITMRQGGGYGRVLSVSSEMAGFVGACDGELSVGQIIGGLAAILDGDASALGRELLPGIRDLVLTGMLVPRHEGL